MKPVDIALVGCGAITQQGYLPALGMSPQVRCRWLVDVQKPLAEELSRRWKIPGASDNYQAVIEQVEAVVIASPNHLHAPMTLEALSRGKSVLCEKPLGRSSEEVRRMVEAARKAGVPLVAGMTFRQYPGLQAIRQAFPWEALGPLRSVLAKYGGALDWPLASPYLFDKEKAGGGVLIDQGVHLLDTLLWVLSVDEATVVEAADDGASGIEAELQAQLLLKFSGGRGPVPCTIEMSRLRRMANRIEVTGEHASLVIPLSSSFMPQLHQNGRARDALELPVAPWTGTRCFAEQLSAFAKQVRGISGSNCAGGESQLRVLELVESCYRLRKPLVQSWEVYEPISR